MLIGIISEIFYVHTCKKSQDFDRDAKTEICIPLIPASVNAFIIYNLLNLVCM